MKPLRRSAPRPTLPILSSASLCSLAQQILSLTTAETVTIRIDHVATGTSRVAQGRVRVTDSGDTLRVNLYTQFGQRAGMMLATNQIDSTSLEQAVRYLERVAREQPGDSIDTGMPTPARSYLPNTVCHDSTISAFAEGRHDALEALIRPSIIAGLTPAAFVGVSIHACCLADKYGRLAAGQATDAEVTAAAWNANGKGNGWAGQAARDWTRLDLDRVAEETVRLTKLAANPVAFEPGRRLVILDRPAVAQLVASMGRAFDAGNVLSGRGPLYNLETRKPRLGEQVTDPRVTLSSDPTDPDGGYFPFDGNGYPRIPMTWVAEGGVLAHLAYDPLFAATQGIAPANRWPDSLRMSGGPATVEEMIAGCSDGIYVNRFTQLEEVDFNSGTITGLTSGACLLIRNGKVEKSLNHFRFLESPWHFLNRIETIGSTERTAFGYAPWHGNWPIAPTIVPPLMIRDFNFNALGDAI